MCAAVDVSETTQLNNSGSGRSYNFGPKFGKGFVIAVSNFSGVS